MSAASDEPSTWGDHLDRAERTLAAAGLREPRDEALALLGLLLGLPRPALHAGLAAPAAEAEAAMYVGWIARRALGEPSQRITGHAEFMGLDLRVGQTSPVVAPYAQRLVELALRACRHQPHSELAAAELGTGCGAIALALATLEPRFARIYALEREPRALETARANGARYLMNLVIDWRAAGSLDAVPEPVDVIVCGGNTTFGGAWHVAESLQQAPGRLRTGGVLVCAFPTADLASVTDTLTRTFMEAQVGFEPQGTDVVIAVALHGRG